MRQVVVLLCLVSATTSCARNAPPPTQESAPRQFPRLLAYYTQYQRANSGVGPADQATWEKFARGQAAADLARRGGDPAEVDQLFVSERDQEPLVVRLGLRLADEKNGPQPFVFERSGKDGKRFVGFLNGRVEEVGSERAATLGLNTP